MDSRRQLETAPVVKIRFNPAGTTTLGGVEMNGNKVGVWIRVGDSNACSEWHEHVAIAGHYYSIPVSCQHLLQSLRDVQGHVLFRDSLARNPASVITTMTRVDHYRSSFAALFGSSPRVSRGKSPQKCHQQAGGKQT